MTLPDSRGPEITNATVNGTEQTKDGLFEMRRLRIRGEWSLETFIAVVTGS